MMKWNSLLFIFCAEFILVAANQVESNSPPEKLDQQNGAKQESQTASHQLFGSHQEQYEKNASYSNQARAGPLDPPQNNAASDSTSTKISGTQGIRKLILGGIKLEGSQFLWTVILYAAIPVAFGDFHFVCVGSLVSTQYVLTSATCAYEFNYPYSMIAIGQGFINYVDRIRIHPQFHLGYKDYNIALLKLSELVELKDGLQLLCLPPPNIYAVNRSATVVGLAGEELDGSRDTVVRGIEVQIISNENCKKNFEATYNLGQYQRTAGPHITTRMLCAWPKKGGKDVCRGDEGGPLILNCGGNNVLIGLVSHEIGCGMSKNPTIYTSVSQLLNWIQTITAYSTCSQHCTGYVRTDSYPAQYYPARNVPNRNMYDKKPEMGKNSYQPNVPPVYNKDYHNPTRQHY